MTSLKIYPFVEKIKQIFEIRWTGTGNSYFSNKYVIIEKYLVWWPYAQWSCLEICKESLLHLNKSYVSNLKEFFLIKTNNFETT